MPQKRNRKVKKTKPVKAKTPIIKTVAEQAGFYNPNTSLDDEVKLLGKTDNIPEFLSAGLYDDDELLSRPEIKYSSEETNGYTTITVDDVPAKDVSDRAVVLMRDTNLEYPVLCLKIWIAGDPDVGQEVEEQRFARMFSRTYSTRARMAEEADLIVFGGGSDVNPDLYGASPHETTFYDDARDKEDVALYKFAKENRIPMMGICRGAQFLHVMNGGKLFQDIDGHHGTHSMLDIDEQVTIDQVSSVHHQSCIPKKGMKILGTASKSMKRCVDDKRSMIGTYADVEAFFYRDTCCLGFQGHPEYYGYHAYTIWCLKQINKYVSENPDLSWEGRFLRLKEDLIQEQLLIEGNN